MKNREIILASNSPRRKELMEDIGIDFRIHSEQCDEIVDHNISKEEAIEQIAYAKAMAVYKKFPKSIVIGADTMVCYDGRMLGKPRDYEDAFQMLSMLSGEIHEVITGVAILCEGKELLFHEKTYVQFYDLNDEIIRWYLSTEEAFDKAGAYGIQGKGKLLVDEIRGDYYNVMGFPIARVYRELKNLQN